VAPFGPNVRRKSVERVIAEVETMRRRHPLRSIHFSDDLFVTDEDWLEEFAEAFPARIGIRFTCNTTVESLTERAVDCLRRAGCRILAIGIESGVERLRKLALGKRAELSNAEIAERAALLHRAGIPFVTFNMVSLPGETIDDAFETIHLNQRIGARYTRVNMVYILPNSELAHHAIRAGLLDPETGTDVRRFPDFAEAKGVRVLETPDRDAFRQLHNLFFLAVRFPRLEPLIRRALRLPPLGVFGLFRLAALYYEQRFFRMTWASGLRYYLHTGHPYTRSKASAMLI